MIDLSLVKEELGGKPVAVFGLGLSGLAAVKCLVKNGIECHAWDDNLDQQAAAQKAGAQIMPLHEEDLTPYGFLLLAPGIPLYSPAPHPVVVRARDAGIEILGDIELFYRANRRHANDPKGKNGHVHNIIAITGTNGKSTTTALVHHILKDNNVPCVMGGNIGLPVLALTLPKKKEYWVVLELSSYQLDLCHDFRADIAVLLNLAPDHLDRHGTMERYIEAKARIFRNGCPVAVVGQDDPHCQEITEYLSGLDADVMRVVPVSAGGEPPQENAIFKRDGHLIDACFGLDSHGSVDELDVGAFSSLAHLPGGHNHQNMLAAYALGRLVGLTSQEIMDSAASFEGLAHRMQTIATINGISYVNDSKATNIDSACRALSCYKKIYWILGGRSKSEGLDGAQEFQERIRHAFLIGEAADEFAVWLDQREIPYTMCGTVDRAVQDAHIMAQGERGEPGGAGTVLLSPACASFDQFSSFEMRGEYFSECVDQCVRQQASSLSGSTEKSA